MLSREKIAAATLALVAFGAMSVAQPAKADDWRGVVRDVLGGDNNGYGYRERNYYGNRDFNRFDRRGDTDVMSLQRRVNSIQNQMQMALNHGQINQWQFNRLAQNLSNVLDQINSMRGRRVDWQTRNMIEHRLAFVEDRLNSDIATRRGGGWY